MFWRNPKEKQFRALIDREAPALYRLAFARLGNAHDAEDVVQECFLKAYRSINSFREGTNVHAWLTTILINTIRDHIRKVTREPSVSSLDEETEDGPIQIPDPTEVGPEQRIIQGELDGVLLKALHSLPDSFLMPVLLRDLHDYSYQQVAQVLDIPIGTVMSRLSRARQMLRAKLKGESIAAGYEKTKEAGSKESQRKQS